MRNRRELDISVCTRYVKAAYYNRLFTQLCSRALAEAAGCSAAGGEDTQQTLGCQHRVHTPPKNEKQYERFIYKSWEIHNNKMTLHVRNVHLQRFKTIIEKKVIKDSIHVTTASHMVG